MRCSSTSSSLFLLSSSSSSSALRCSPFMAKLPCQAGLQNHPGFLLPSSSSSSSSAFRTFRMAALSAHSMVPCGGGGGGGRLGDESKCASVLLNSRLKPGFLNSAIRSPGNALSYYWPLSASMAWSSVDYGVFSTRRHFSQVSGETKEEESVGGFTKHDKKKKKKKSKPLAASRAESGITDSSTTSANNEKVDHATNNSNVNSTKRKQSKSKKSAEQTSKSIASKGGQSPKKEKTSTGNAIEEVSDNSAPTATQSKKKSGRSSKKEKSVKRDNESIEKRKPEKMGQLNNVGQEKLKQLFPPSGKSVVVVESVTKAKIIQGYLGDTFEVLPSYGHVRDLAARSGSVRPDDDFSMVWEVPATAWTHLKSIKVALSGAENLILASDPDREGEAIAWHIIEMLKQQDALSQDISVARVVFHEITEASIKGALQAPRRIDVNLVHAYLARRALDYLIGFNISPLLWRKLPGCRSAGRVQSAALSLICDREMEIDDFKPQEYWTIEAELSRKELDCAVNANLTHVDSKKLNQLSISSHTEAKDIQKKIESVNFQVVGTKKSKVRKNPPTPYITSTLQQDAANKLHFGSTYTMKLAQKLYEGIQLADGKATGLITYHRTDGLHVSDEAVQDIRSIVIERYGPDFASSGARKYFKKVKNAQEAHEAIRPTNIRVLPSMLVEVLDEDSLKLYTLIWSRTMACQMEPATFEQIVVEIGDAAKSLAFRSACLRVEFLGYQAVYEDAEAGTIRSEENEAYDRHKSFEILKNLKLGEPLNLGEMELKQHFTQPPSRYSEGSLVKKLEELGIGRPSTYASTLKVLQDRNYVTVKNRVLHPEFRGRMVSAFLSHHFTEVTDYSFTADMETELDNVSAGLTEWKGLLSDYWTRFSSHCKKAENIHLHQVEKMLEKTFGAMLFGSLPDNNRTCPSCMEGTLIFKVSRYGAGYFIGCDQHPRCRYIAKSLYGEEEDDDDIPQIKHPVEEPKLLGFHPVSNEKILLKSGPYGFYVQLGEDRKGYAPKRASVSHFKDMEAITLENAVEWLRYPVTLGNHPKDGQPVTIKLGNIGFSIRHRRSIASVPKNMKPEDITMDKALKLLSGNKVRQCGRPKGKPKLEEALEAM